MLAKLVDREDLRMANQCRAKPRPRSLFSGSAAARLITSSGQGKKRVTEATPPTPVQKRARNHNNHDLYMPGMSLGEIDSFDLTESEDEFDERASSLFERPPVGAGSYNLTCTQQNSGGMQGSEQQSFETTVIRMLQEHQVQFQRLFAGQTSMEDRQCRMEGHQHEIDKKFSMLQEKLDRYSAASPSSSSSNDGKRKRVVTRALSVSGSILLVFRLFLVTYSNPGIYYYADNLCNNFSTFEVPL